MMAIQIDATALVEGARQVLQGNDLGQSTKPAPGLYPHQWNWDSCFIAIGISHFDTARAGQELQSLLRGQWDNGLVPQIVFNPNATGYFPGPDVWQSERSPDAPKDVATSGISQPPVLATAALAIWKNAKDKALAGEILADLYPKIVRFHEFFYRERNPDGDGLIVVVHPWESGLDNSPPYLDAGSRVHLTYRPQYTRLDTLHVAAKNRPTNKDYDLYVYLLELMRSRNWDQGAYLADAPLQVQDVLFNSILCRANLDLATIAGILGEECAQALMWADETTLAINERLWDDQAKTYYSFDRVAHQLLKDDTVAGFLPLWGQVAPRERAVELLKRLRDPSYWPHDGYPIPTTAIDSPYFNPENYWLGPVWVNTNWMVLQGLHLYSQDDVASAVAQHTLELVQKSGYREYYNPFTGEGYGTDSFSWTAALTIDLVDAMSGA